MRGLHIRLNEEQLAFQNDWRRRHRIHFTALETVFLHTLWRCHGRIVSHAALSDAIWPDDDGWDGKSLFDERLRVHVCRIRKKLGDPIGILTIWGQGYVMNRPEIPSNPMQERK